jgi:hypothetical protein
MLAQGDAALLEALETYRGEQRAAAASTSLPPLA